MNISHRDSNRKVKCRECGEYVKKAVNIVLQYYPPTCSWATRQPIYLCKKCLSKLRCEIDALTILVKTGINTK